MVRSSCIGPNKPGWKSRHQSNALHREHYRFINAGQPHPLAVFHSSQRSGKEGVQALLEKRVPDFGDRASIDMPPFYPWW